MKILLDLVLTNPGLEAVKNSTLETCRNIVPIVPIVESESWMLADKELFKEEIGSQKPNAELGIEGNPELIGNPKNTIEHAIQITVEGLPKKRYKPKISELYQPIGQKVRLSELSKLSSYQKFEQSARESLKKLKYLPG